MVVIRGKWNKKTYTLLEKIGEGAFGEIFKVRDSIGFIRAIKISKNTSSITREYYVMDKLKSLLSIPKVYDYDDWEIEGSIYHFIVMDYIRGDNLKEYAKKNKLSLNTIFDMGLKIAKFLEDVYKLGFKYTDMKLENILLDNGKHIYFIDFGGVVEKNKSMIEYTPCYNLISWRNAKNNKYSEQIIFTTSMIIVSLIFNREYSPVIYELAEIITKIEASRLSKNIKNILKSGLMGTYVSLSKYKSDLIKLSWNFKNTHIEFQMIDYFFVGSIIFCIFSIIFGIKVWFF